MKYVISYNEFARFFNAETATGIMDCNLVRANFFEWDFGNWKPLKKKLF